MLLLRVVTRVIKLDSSHCRLYESEVQRTLQFENCLNERILLLIYLSIKKKLITCVSEMTSNHVNTTTGRSAKLFYNNSPTGFIAYTRIY
jgi:hypothetical protein